MGKNTFGHLYNICCNNFVSRWKQHVVCPMQVCALQMVLRVGFWKWWNMLKLNTCTGHTVQLSPKNESNACVLLLHHYFVQQIDRNDKIILKTATALTLVNMYMLYVCCWIGLLHYCNASLKLLTNSIEPGEKKTSNRFSDFVCVSAQTHTNIFSCLRDENFTLKHIDFVCTVDIFTFISVFFLNFIWRKTFAMRICIVFISVLHFCNK